MRSQHPELYASAGGEPSLHRELSYARARLGALALRADTPEDAVNHALDVVRRLGEAVAAMAHSGVPPAGERGPWRLTLVVRHGERDAVVPGEGRHPMEGSAPPGDAEDEGSPEP